MNRNLMVIAIAALATGIHAGSAFEVRPRRRDSGLLPNLAKLLRRPNPRHRYDDGKPPVNGDRECTRRRRQIARGILTTSNGLVLA